MAVIAGLFIAVLAASSLRPARCDLQPVDGQTHIEFVTAGADRTKALPLIVGLHSLGSDPETFAQFLCDLPFEARVVLPRASHRHKNGFSWFVVGRHIERTGPGVRAAASRMAAWIESVRNTRPTLGKPIVTGFSQGGMLAYALAVHHPEVVGSAVPIGAYLPHALWPRRGHVGARIYAFHGEKDGVIHVARTRRLFGRFRALRWNARLRIYGASPHALTRRMRRDLHRLLPVLLRS